jgi:homoserine dehydrogenase
MTKKIGLVGLGLVGTAIAESLLEKPPEIPQKSPGKPNTSSFRFRILRLSGRLSRGRTGF